ncbi:tyrosine-type recombinase/integrase [Olivibacter sitiensis]|uniref:tyrosine-type recombinase/integrase n=1 Tax=Olivibacter sitiensis TaxID=376470 RepID=UPI000405C61C|nr:tyrosine-type recombinase/integrase [Olivibacter sitiensis]
MPEIHYLSKSEADLLLRSAKNYKQKCLILLMLDAGLRVSEACSLRLQNFDFKHNIINVHSLKKRDKTTIRTVPMSDRLYQAIANYLPTLKTTQPDAFLFPSHSADGHIGRKRVWRILATKKIALGIPQLHPHALRHTFATHHLNEGTKLEEIKTMLGHSSYDTTLIYASIPTDKLKERVNLVTSGKRNWLQRLLDKIRTPARKIINLDFARESATFGRNAEIRQLNENVSKNINTIVIAPTGLGKSHLLKQIQTQKKMLKIDDTENFKGSLANILLLLHENDKNAVLALIWKEFSKDQIATKVQRETALNLCELIKQAVEPKEYVLMIDDITRITPSGKKVLDRLKDTFVIVTSAREIKASDTAFLWNFEVMKLKPLDRENAMRLIHHHATGMEVENPELFRNHIYDQTGGNPRAITEMIERYRAEPFLTNEAVLKHRHVGALQEIDMSFALVLLIAIMTAMRYLARDLENPNLRLIGAIGMILLIISRPIFRGLKRKNL